MSQYTYARDWRSDGKYKIDFDYGTLNQELAIQQLILDRLYNGQDNLSYVANPDKRFQSEDGNWQYRADYIVYKDDIAIPTEVKVQMADLGETVDLKLTQINNLTKANGVVLYATQKHYCLVHASYIKEVGIVVNSDRFGGKPVYQVDVNLLRWTGWVHRPEFKKYRYDTY